jgi:hypothetical protein
MKHILITLTVFAFFNTLPAQVIDTNALKNFDAAIVAKVYSFARYTTLTSSQQQYLAFHYKITDSITKAWILQGKPAASIDSFINKSSHMFYEMNNIDASNKAAFSDKNSAAFAAMASKGEMDYIQEEYKPGPHESKIIQQWVAAKYKTIYQRYLMNENDSYSAKQSAGLYDLYNFYPALYAGKYISDYIEKLNGIKKLPDSTQLKIRNGFLNMVRSNKYADWSNALLTITRHLLPDTALFSKLYHDELTRQAIANSAADKYNLINVQHISYNAFNGVFDLVVQKNYANALIQYTYGPDNPYIVDSLIFLTSRHYDSTIKASLIRDGSIQPGSQFAIALKYKDYLKLDPRLTDTLVFHAMKMAHWQDSVQLRDPFVWIDYSDYESRILSALLTEEQYTGVLMIKNKSNAYLTARKAWDDLEKFHLTGGLNKEQTIIQIAEFHIAWYSAWNRMAHDSKRQTANTRALDEIKPEILKKLEQARWNATVEKPANDARLKW